MNFTNTQFKNTNTHPIKQKPCLFLCSYLTLRICFNHWCQLVLKHEQSLFNQASVIQLYCYIILFDALFKNVDI